MDKNSICKKCKHAVRMKYSMSGVEFNQLFCKATREPFNTVIVMLECEGYEEVEVDLDCEVYGEANQ